MLLRAIAIGLFLFSAATFMGCSSAGEDAYKEPVVPSEDPTIPQNPPEGGMEPGPQQ